MYYSIIHGLVIRDSLRGTKIENPARQASSKLWNVPVHAHMRQPSPKPSEQGFLLCTARLVSDAESAVMMRRRTKQVVLDNACHRVNLVEQSLTVQRDESRYSSRDNLRPASLTNLLPVPHTTARACMGRVGVNTGTRYLREPAEQPVREGLRKVYGSSGDNRPVFRVTRGVMRTLGLFMLFRCDKAERGWKRADTLVSPLAELWRNE